jgi:hypothetical protein
MDNFRRGLLGQCCKGLAVNLVERKKNYLNVSGTFWASSKKLYCSLLQLSMVEAEKFFYTSNKKFFE